MARDSTVRSPARMSWAIWLTSGLGGGAAIVSLRRQRGSRQAGCCDRVYSLLAVARSCQNSPPNDREVVELQSHHPRRGRAASAGEVQQHVSEETRMNWDL